MQWFLNLFFFKSRDFFSCEILCSPLAFEFSKAKVVLVEAGQGDRSCELGKKTQKVSARIYNCSSKISLQILPTYATGFFLFVASLQFGLDLNW